MGKEFSGIIVSGKEEGDYYVRIYNPFFKKKLGKTFYEGTLNIKTTGVSYPSKFVKVQHNSHYRTVNCYKILLNNRIECYAVLPQVLKRDDNNIVEVIAEERLRDRLFLKDGDKTTIKFLDD